MLPTKTKKGRRIPGAGRGISAATEGVTLSRSQIHSGVTATDLIRIMLYISVGKVLVFLLVTIQVFTFLCVVMKLHFNLNPIAPQPAHTHILILSSWRSGSSFTGQLFSQHPDVFYLMEPAWHVWGTMPSATIKVLHMMVRDLLRSLFLCDMSVFDAYMPEKRIKSELFQWETSRALCSPPACEFFSRYDIIPQFSCRTVCGKYPFDTVEKACKTYSHVVIKEVRVFDIRALYPFLEDPSLNFKILHLVRDPRAVFHSREKSPAYLASDRGIVIGGENNKKEDAPFRIMEKVCKSQVDIYRTGTNGTNSRLRDRYMMVRYEDIAKDPLGKARQMYQFANLHFTPKLMSWVYNMTHGSGQGNDFVISSRDAVNISMAWRKALPFDSIRRVQDSCKEALEEFGFRSLQNEGEQKDLALGLVLPVPGRHSAEQFEFSWKFQ